VVQLLLAQLQVVQERQVKRYQHSLFQGRHLLLNPHLGNKLQLKCLQLNLYPLNLRLHSLLSQQVQLYLNNLFLDNSKTSCLDNSKISCLGNSKISYLGNNKIFFLDNSKTPCLGNNKIPVVLVPTAKAFSATSSNS
jgi:hypothetical protein